MASPKWLNDSEMKAWRGFVTTSLDLMNAIERDLGAFGLDAGDYQLLAMLSEAPDHKLKMCDLADTLRLSRSGLTRRMDGVVKAKYVERIQDKDDRRVSFAHLTAKGYEFLKKVAPLHLKDVRSRMIDLLNESEIKAIGSAFAKINAHLRATE
ncbi:MAG: MarR family transcriptional regulator [Actinobacteria bacterium]|nr:MarR family transcriptional regulator [Actinomycetota bacterium]